MNSVLSMTSGEDLKKYRFVLKLWIVTNDESISYLRWNCDQTYLIVNIYELMQMFCTGESNIFTCNTMENFLWLMYKHGFDKCSRDVLAESERYEHEPDCMVFAHPQFIGSNAAMFEAWLSFHSVRTHDMEQKGSCTIPPQIHFMVRENMDEFAGVRMQIMSVMMYLESLLRQPLRTQENVAIAIPEQHVDYQVMDEPDYFKTKEIEGNYGPVTVSELKQCLGELLPRTQNDLADDNAENEIDMEEVEVLEDNEASEEADLDIMVVEEPSAITTESSICLQFNDLRELYENADVWTDSDGNLIEYHEVYELDVGAPQAVKVQEVEEEDNISLQSLSILPLQTSEAVVKMDDNISAHLTNSVQACLPALDYE
uniref:HSF-type DNA-binding domain-containing protein n=1 Tax=Anopheles culicifacies TaxID=139723 RepID=A0A182LUP7_9DIPT